MEYSPTERESTQTPSYVNEGDEGAPRDQPAGQEYLTDEEVIRAGIEAALTQDRNIDDRTAVLIAARLRSGQTPALNSFAATGEIPDDLDEELWRDSRERPDQAKKWMHWLTAYCMDRADKGPVAEWNTATAGPRAADDEAATRQDLMSRIAAGSVTTLGAVAIVRIGDAGAGAGDDESPPVTSSRPGRTKLVPSPDESHDERLIRQGIAAAGRELRQIDDRTARYIAGQLHGGQASALYSLASTGNIIEDNVYRELYADLDDQTPQVAAWVEALRTYCQARPDQGPVRGWAENAAALDRMDAARERAHQLGGIAVAPEVAAIDGEPAADHGVHPDRLDELFGEPPDEEVGRADELGWFGLIVNHGTGGGTIISQDEQGFRYVWESHDGEALDQRWRRILAEYADYEDALVERERHGLEARHERVGYACPSCEEPIVDHMEGLYQATWTHEDGEPLCPVVGSSGYEPAQPGVWKDGEVVPLAGEADGDDADGDGPRVYVASLADYTNGVLHGRWVAADRDAEDLQAAVARVLATSPARRRGGEAEEWAVHDYDGFEDDVTGVLGEWPSLEDLSKVAKGIAEHGLAYGAWVAYVGRASDELVDRFEDFYRGEWGSLTDYAQDYLEQTEFYRFLDDLPEELRHYVSVDVEQYAEDMACELHVADTPEGGVWVFTTS